MISVSKTIQQLTGERSVSLTKPFNRYAVTVKKDGKKSNFFFSTPIYHRDTKRVVSPCFVQKGNVYTFSGSNASIQVTNTAVVFQTKMGKMRISWGKAKDFVMSPNGYSLHSQDMTVYPTLNGIAVRQRYTEALALTFESELQSDGSVKSNSKYFAYMKSKFTPFLTLNAMYAENREEDVFHALVLKATKKSPKSALIRLQANSTEAYRCVWEINAYEPKLMQDTTVESRRKNENNAFGNVAFIGRSEPAGLQYLYSRFDFSKISEKHKRKIERVYLHIPYYMATGDVFRISAPFRRFCSFGSKWKNKVAYKSIRVSQDRKNGYISLDLSEYLLNQSGDLQETTGIVLRPAGAEGFSILATADNYFTPQILEIQYKTKE